MRESLEPVPSARIHLHPALTSLMSGASAHTLKPELAAGEAVAPRARRLSWKMLAVTGVSASLGLLGAASLSHLRAHPAPVMQIVSGTPQLKKSSDGASVRWHSSKNKVYFDESLDSAGPHAREAVQLGFGTWLGSGAHLPNVSFDSTRGAHFGQEPNGKSEVMYGPITLAGHENDLALTVTFSDPTTGAVVESDMIFNSRHPYGVLPYATKGKDSSDSGERVDEAECNQKYDLQSVATHEAGHFFGLGEDFDAKQATMFYTTGRCETNKRVLQNSDEGTMNALYLQNDVTASADDAGGASETAKGCGGARIGQGQTSGAVPTLSVLSLLGFIAARRKRRNKRGEV